MEYIIKNEFLEATISSFGAELVKLVDCDGVDRLHTASNDTWNRVSPILFPQISRTPNSEYKVKGQIYKMPAHGFIRDNELELIKYTQNEVTLKYSHNEKTLEIYPYKFNFHVTYKLDMNILEVSFNIQNPSDKKLLYMIGGHPGFKVPLFDNELFTDYSILFGKKETNKRMCVVDGFLANVYEDYLSDTDIINLNHNLFVDDAIVFKNLKSSYVDIVSKNHDKKIRFHFSDFNILAIWSKTNENANFLCLEPWNGIQKEFVVEHEKMGVLELDAYQSMSFCYKIEVI